MKSNVCKIEKGTKDLAAILKESEKVAVYNELTHKQTLQLRLICEEMDGMLPNIIDDFSGDFWIEFEDGVCKVNASIQFDKFTADKKEGLVAIAKNKKNAAATGIVGKIRSAIEDVFCADGGDDIAIETRYIMPEYYNSMDYHAGMDYACLWSLEQYRSTVKKEEKTEALDELEKSVIASVADDVIVGVKGKRAGITVVKKFI
jgi:hypothetical protein